MRPDHRKDAWSHHAYRNVRVRGHAPEEGGPSGFELARNLRRTFADCAKPEAVRDEDGMVSLNWGLTHLKTRLTATAGTGFTGVPADFVQVEKVRMLSPLNGETEDLGEMSLSELVRIVVKETGHWRPNRWRSTSYRKEEGPYALEVFESAGGTSYHPLGYRISENGRVVRELEGAAGTWDDAMRAAQSALRRYAREQKLQHRTYQRGLAFEQGKRTKTRTEAEE